MELKKDAMFTLLIKQIILLLLIVIVINENKYADNDSFIYKDDDTLLLCPIKEFDETEEDCPWAAITRLCVLEKNKNKVEDIFKKHCPDLLKSIKDDSENKIMKSVWGKSFNYDVNKEEIIVRSSILDLILKIAKVPLPATSRLHDSKKIIVHAGIIHTYGYVFSNLMTPYGYKRSRWVKDDIETGFGLPMGMLGPQPSSGTLFSNITYFISRIAFYNDLNILKNIIRSSAPEVLQKFNYEKLNIRRLEETVDLNKNRTIIIRTDLIEFNLKQEGKSNEYLLIYSFEDSSKKTPLLITTFPVSAKFVLNLFKRSNLGKNKIIKTKYNAFISGLTDSENIFTGLRKEL